MKVCSKCRREKDASEFHTNQFYCKECARMAMKEFYLKNKNIKKYAQGDTKKCLKCNTDKDCGDFYYGCSVCKKCYYAKRKDYRIVNSEKMYEYQVNWRKDNKEKVYKYQVNWKKDNNEKVLSQRKKWVSENRMKRASSQLKYKINNTQKIRAHQLAREIPAKPCLVCGELKTEKHHPNYKYPLRVVHLCTKHHKMVHAKIRENLRTTNHEQ